MLIRYLAPAFLHGGNDRETHEFYLAPLRALERATWLPYILPLYHCGAATPAECTKSLRSPQPAPHVSCSVFSHENWRKTFNIGETWRGVDPAIDECRNTNKQGIVVAMSAVANIVQGPVVQVVQNTLSLSLPLYKFMANIAKLTSKYVGSYYWIVGEAKTATWVTRKYQTNRSTLPTNMSQRNALLAIF